MSDKNELTVHKPRIVYRDWKVLNQPIIGIDKKGYHLVESKCIACGKPYAARQTELLIGRSKFCGTKCAMLRLERIPIDISDRLKNWARHLTAAALRRGEIQSAPCDDCGLDSHKIHAHHLDYKDFNDIAWLCPKCHARRHMLICGIPIVNLTAEEWGRVRQIRPIKKRYCKPKPEKPCRVVAPRQKPTKVEHYNAGHNNPRAKLSDDIVLSLRHLPKVNFNKESERLSVSHSALYHAVRGLSWKHLPLPNHSL